MFDGRERNGMMKEKRNKKCHRGWYMSGGMEKEKSVNT